MKVFVTGSSGFVGRSVVAWLRARGHRALLMQRRNPSGDADVWLADLERLAVDPADLTATLRVFDPDAVVHLAWGKATNTHRDDPCHYTENLRFTQHLVDAVAGLPACFFVGVGSQAEYGVQNRPLTPQTPASPLNAYGKAKKIAGEYALARLGERASWLRLLTAYGPGDDANKFIPYLLRCYRDGTTANLSPGDQSWDWLHVTDAAAAIGAAAEARAAGLHVLASGEMCTMKEIATRLRAHASALGLPAPMPNFGGRPYNANELFFLGGDAASLRRASGWSPRVTLTEGIKTLF